MPFTPMAAQCPEKDIKQPLDVAEKQIEKGDYIFADKFEQQEG
ncbi:MAG: hypothetical protein ACPG7E_09115 [Marinirhabdus sp.]